MTTIQQIVTLVALATVGGCTQDKYIPHPVHSKVLNNLYSGRTDWTDNDAEYQPINQYYRPQADNPNITQPIHNKITINGSKQQPVVQRAYTIQPKQQYAVPPQDNDSYYIPYQPTQKVVGPQLYPQDNDSVYVPYHPPSNNATSSDNPPYPQDNDSDYIGTFQHLTFD